MIHRRLKNLAVAGFTICCLWWIFRATFNEALPVTEEYSYSITPGPPRSRIGKASIAVNSLNSSLMHDALRTHKVQNDLYGYTHHISTIELVDDLVEKDFQHRPRGAWSKPAYLLSIILTELVKLESERLDWIFWFDADTIVLNPHTPLEIFLPPDSVAELSNVHLLVASNWDGLNSGALAFRVHPWSASVLSVVLAYPVYRQEKLKTDRFRDQSAFQWLLEAHDSPLAATPMKGKDNWAKVPMRWFNSMPINNAWSKSRDWIFNHNMTDDLFDKGTDEVYDDGNGKVARPWKIRQGDMVVHCAGANPVRESWMGGWLRRAELYLPEWSNATKQEDLKVETAAFWEGFVHQRRNRSKLPSSNTSVPLRHTQ